ncbi:MAG: response regulator [Anaerolineae bacterium]|nr:response regulator [Anaerolineae bacterium]
MKAKILIVDDELDTLKLVGMFLQSKGYDIIAAKTGASALEKASGEAPDLIILDVMMPDMNGFEVCRRLRTQPKTASIPVMMLTAKSRITDRVVGFEAGADEYLSKPIRPAELLDRMEILLQRVVDRRNGS